MGESYSALDPLESNQLFLRAAFLYSLVLAFLRHSLRDRYELVQFGGRHCEGARDSHHELKRDDPLRALNAPHVMPAEAA